MEAFYKYSEFSFKTSLFTDNDIGTINPHKDTTNNTTDHIIIDQEEYIHRDYLSFLILIMIAFFILSYYLYYISKFGLKKAKNNNSETTAIQAKYDIMKYLSTANFSKI